MNPISLQTNVTNPPFAFLAQAWPESSRDAFPVGVLVFGLGAVGGLAIIGLGQLSIPVLAASALMVVVVCVAITAIRETVGGRKQRLVDLQERATRAEEATQTATRLAVAQERSRLAREMHDIVAHGISVISVQAAAGQRVVAADPDRAVTIFEAIEDTGREALTEMRCMLGVLRNGDSHAGGLVPQPSLGNLDDAIDHCVQAGLPTKLTTTGEHRRLAPGIELAAYRIIQEALTNVLKHGGDASTADVVISYAPTAMSITITDTGRGAMSNLSSTGSGKGLLGMQERVDAYDGEFAAGPKSGGGYQVRASFPLNGHAGAV